MGRAHAVEAPMGFIGLLSVVGMKQNNIRLDPEVPQPGDLLFQMLEEGGIEAGEIPLPGRRPLEGVKKRLDAVENVPFREHAHAQLVKGSMGKRLEGAL